MHRILLIETSTALCSVALSEDGRTVCSRESTGPRQHASLTAVFIKEVLDEAGIKAGDCHAVCLSSGPGSYTGLRVGSSSAKGICFAAGIPLIAVSSLDILASQAIQAGLAGEDCSHIIPLIDARRMEVYTATYDRNGSRISETVPLVVEPESFGKELSGGGKVVFIGDGAEKCSRVITAPNAVFHNDFPRASAMAPLAEKAFVEGRFEDYAYFEPFYLKQFVATTGKKQLF